MRKKYHFEFKFSKNGGKTWLRTTTDIYAESEESAYFQLEQKYRSYELDAIRLLYVR